MFDISLICEENNVTVLIWLWVIYQLTSLERFSVSGQS